MERSGAATESGYGPGVLRRGGGDGGYGAATSRLWDPQALGPPLSGCGAPERLHGWGGAGQKCQLFYLLCREV